MRNSELTPRQRETYISIINEYEKLRNLSEREKEVLIDDITGTTFIDITSDWAFRHVFGRNKENLMLLLNDILPEKIIDLKYEPNAVDVFKGDDKQVIMDVLCRSETGKFIVEMQKVGNDEFRNRMFYYGSASVTRQLSAGDSYNKLVPVYVVCIMNFSLVHSADQLIYRYRLQEQDTGEVYGNQLTIYFCELPRFAGAHNEILSPVEEWFEIFKNMRNFVNRPRNVNKRFDPIFEACRRKGLSDKEELQYFRAMIESNRDRSIANFYRQEGFADGMEKGMEKGMKLGLEKALSRLVENGFSEAEARLMLDLD